MKTGEIAHIVLSEEEYEEKKRQSPFRYIGTVHISGDNVCYESFLFNIIDEFRYEFLYPDEDNIMYYHPEKKILNEGCSQTRSPTEALINMISRRVRRDEPPNIGWTFGISCDTIDLHIYDFYDESAPKGEKYIHGLELEVTTKIADSHNKRSSYSVTSRMAISRKNRFVKLDMPRFVKDLLMQNILERFLLL